LIGTPMEPRNVNRRFEQLRDTAGLGWLHPHDLRHAFATFLADQGEDLRTGDEAAGSLDHPLRPRLAGPAGRLGDRSGAQGGVA